MYYLPFEAKGYKSKGKLYNHLYELSLTKGFKALTKQVQNSFGNVVYIKDGILDKNKLHNDLSIKIDSTGSSGSVLISRYIQPKVNGEVVDIILDPPIELCRINIH